MRIEDRWREFYSEHNTKGGDFAPIGPIGSWAVQFAFIEREAAVVEFARKLPKMRRRLMVGNPRLSWSDATKQAIADAFREMFNKELADLSDGEKK